MRPDPHPSRGRLAVTAIALELLLGVGALAGGLALILGPRGSCRCRSTGWPARRSTPTSCPGLVLFTILGIGSLVVAVLAWRRHPAAPLLTTGVGVVLLIWLAVQIAIMGFGLDPPLQPIYLALDVILTFIGLAWWPRTRSAHP